MRLTCIMYCLIIGVMSVALSGSGAYCQERLVAGQTIAELAIPEGVVVEPDIAYREGASPAWKLDLAMPAEQGTPLRPAIVFVHGGGWRNGDKRRPPFLGGALEFAAQGYVCITVEYRLTGEALFPACIEDVKCAVRWLRAHAAQYHVNPEKIGAFGISAGAHLVAMLGLCSPSAGLEGDGPWQEYSSMVQAVCCSATPASFVMPMNNRVVFVARRGESPQQAQEAPRRSERDSWTEEQRRKYSPLTYVTADAPPFLIIHDATDNTVNVRQGDALYNALNHAGARYVNYLRFDQKFGHGVFMNHLSVTRPARAAFFDFHLKGSAE